MSRDTLTASNTECHLVMTPETVGLRRQWLLEGFDELDSQARYVQFALPTRFSLLCLTTPTPHPRVPANC